MPAPQTRGGRVTSIYQRAMGPEFNRLHPMIQKRFGFSSQDKVASIGRGVMEKVWYGKPYTLPFLYVGTWRRIMFPERGENVPFTIRNYAYVDKFGRETVTWVRDFEFAKTRRFDATMIYSEQRNLVVDYLGTHQHLSVDIHLSADSDGGLRIRSGEQRFYEGFLGFRFPMLFSGVADVKEWHDDARGKFGIKVEVTNPVWGPLFGYNGWFDAEWTPCDPAAVPADVKPLREERRE
jgi:hypothetical protein